MRAAIALLLLAACADASPAPDLALVGVDVIDVETASVAHDMTVLIGGDRILRVERAGESGFSETTRVLDGAGLYVIPGLWDMHTHALWRPDVADAFLPLFVAHGITGIRDMGGTMEELHRLRTAEASPDPFRPRVVASGPVLDGPQPIDPSISLAVETPEEAARAVDELAAAGADFVKVYTMLPREAYFAVLEAAAARGLPVAGHVPGEVTPIEAAQAGQVSIEHLRDEIDPPLCEPAEPGDCDPVIGAFGAAGTYQTPTLVVLRAKSVRGYVEDADAPPDLALLPDVVTREWEALAGMQRERPADYFAWRGGVFRDEVRLVGRLHDAGVPLLAGSDTGNPFIVPGASLHDELAWLVEAGLTPAAALATATTVPARFLGAADSLGAVRAGYAADLVLLEASPLEHISATRRVRAVVRAGELLTREDLDAAIEALRANAERPGDEEGGAP
ncbi:MAG: amidohydrolase family protein [Gemmatimonadota bacterium]